MKTFVRILMPALIAAMLMSAFVGVEVASAALQSVKWGAQGAAVTYAGGSTTFTVTVAQDSQHGVSLSPGPFSGGPTGLTFSSSPACDDVNGSNPFTVTVTVPTGTAPGTYSLVATATRYNDSSDCSGTVDGSTLSSSASGGVNGTLTIGQATQTITYTSTAPSGKVYSGSNNQTYSVTATGGASGNAVTFTIDSSSTSGCTISGSTVSYGLKPGTCVIDANQTGNTDYSAATQVQQSFTIGQATQTINFTSTAPSGKVYSGSNNQTYSVTATGGASGNAVTFTIDSSSTSGCTISGSTVSYGLKPGTCVIDANQTGNTDYSAATQVQQSFTIGQATQTINFTSTAPSGKVYSGSNNQTYSVTATGGASGNAVTFTIDSSSTSGCTISGSTVSYGLKPGTCVIDANQTGNTDYSAATQVQQSFTIGQATQTINFTSTAPSGKVYSGSNNQTYSVTATGGASGNAVTFTIDSSSTSGCTISGSTVSYGLKPGTCVIDANQTGNTDYSAATQVQQSFTIGQAIPSVTVTNNSVLAGGSLVFTATVTGPSGGTSPTGTVTWAVTQPGGGSVSCSSSSGPTGSSNSVTYTCTINNAIGGTYSATATYPGDSNYSSNSGSDNTASVAQIIPQDSPSSGSTTTSASSSFTDQLNPQTFNGHPVTYTVSTSVTGISVSSSGAIKTTQTFGVGTYTISGTDSDGVGDSGTWSFQLSVTETSILQAAPNSGSTTYGASLGFTDQLNPQTFNGQPVTYTVVASVPGISVSSSGAIMTTNSFVAGTYTVSGTDADGIGDTGTWSYKLTVNPSRATVTVTASSPSVTYGDPTPTITAGYSGLLGGDTFITGVSCSTTYVPGDAAGTYATSCSGPASTSDYTSISYVGGTLTVNPSSATVTVTASSPSVTYGDPTPTITAGYSGLLGGDTFITGVSCSTTYVPGDAAGTYATSCSGPASTSDYTSISYVGGTLTVNPSSATVTVTASSPSVTYGDPTPTITAGYSGLLGGDTFITGVSCSTTYVPGDAAGTYATSCSGPASTSDYTSISYVGGTLTVNPSSATVTVTASSPSVTYGDPTPTITAGYSGLLGGDTFITGVSCSTTYVPGDAAGTYATSCSGPASTSDYTSISYVGGTLTVNPSSATVTVTASSPSVTYGDPTPTITAGYSGLLGGDTFITGVSCSTTYVPGDAAGTYATSCSGPASTSDYTSISYVGGTLTVNPSSATVTVTASSPSVTYGDPTPTITAGYSGLLGGDTFITGVSCSTTYVPGDAAGTYATSCSGPASTSDYTSISYVGGTLTVNPSSATVTVTASSPSVTYGDPTPTITAGYSGLLGGDTFITGVSCSTTYVPGDAAGTYATSCSGPASTSDYTSISYVGGTLTVNPSSATVTVTASSPSVTYGDPTPTITAGYSGLLGGDTFITGVSCSTTYVPGDAAGTYATSCSGPASTSDYTSISYVGGTLTVNPSSATVTVTASSPSVTYGDPTPTITAGYSGLLGGDTFITGVSCSTTYVPGDAAGTYATSCSGPASTSDYTSISYVGGTLTVNPSSATVTVTASSPSVTYGDPTPTITAGYSGLLGGDTFITGVSCSTTYVPGDAAGTYATSCSGPASTSDYTSISYVGGTLTVNPSSATVTVTASSPSVTYGDPTPTITAGYSGLLGGDTFITGVSCSTTYVPGDAAGTYATSCSGPASTSDYTSISYVGGTLTVNPSSATVTVTASSPSVTYGDPTPTITAGYSGLLGGDTFITGVSCSTTYVPGDAAGTYATSCSGPASTSDYTSISYVGGTLTVNPSSATVTVTASSPSVTYGDPTPTITAGYSGLLGGDTFITGVSCSTTYVPGDAAGTYATSCSGPASTSDYTSISYVGGTLTVNPSSATVTVTASSPSVTYGDPTPTITAGYSGLLGGDTFITGVSCSTTYVPGDAAGTYATSCSGPASTSDYTSISYVGGTLTVNPSSATVTVTASSPSVTYGDPTPTITAGYSGLLGGDTFITGVSCSTTYVPGDAAGTYATSCSGPASTSDYTSISYVGGTLTVNPSSATVTVTASSPSVTYGDPTPTITAGYSGLLGGDTFITGVSCSTTYVPGDAAGTYATSCSGPASTSDYTSISYVGGTLTVNPSSATVTVTASSPSVTYGDPTPTITAGYSGLLGGDTFITGVSCSTTYVPGDAAGTYATSCSGPASTSDYTSISYVGGTLTVNPSSATVTVTASSPSVTYGDPTPTITAGYSGLLGGDTFITGVSCSTTYVPGDAAGTYATSCSGPASTSDYTSISYVGGTLTVNPSSATVTVTASSPSVTYGDPTPTITAGYSGLLGGDTFITGVSCSTTYVPGDAAGTYATSCSGPASTSDYTSISYVGGTLTVNPSSATVTVTASSPSVTYGDPTPTITAGYSGLLGGDTFITGVSCSTTYVPGDAAGTYATSCSGPASTSDYTSISYVGGTLTVNPSSATVTVTASSPSVTYGDPTPTITAGYSGLLGGDTFITGVSCSTTYVPGDAAGTYATSCSGPASTSDYTSISYVGGTLTVNPSSATVTVTASSPSVTYGDPTPTITAGYSGLLGGDTFITGVSCSTTYVPGDAAGTYATSCSGPASTSDYTSISYVGGTLTVNPSSATVTVTASSPSVTYGDPTPTITAGYSGLLGGDTFITGVSCSTTYVPGDAAGTYATSCSGPASTSDYTSISYVGGTLTVNPSSATVTVTASSPSVTYGDPTPTITAGYSGLLGGDTFITGVSCSTTYVPGDAAGTYATSCSGPASTSDYTSISYVGGTLTVNPSSATVTVTASSPSVTYGDPTPTITAGYSGLLGGDTFITGVSCSTTYVPGDAAGTYATSCSGPASTSDYTSISYVGGTLTVNPSSATVTVTASSPSVTYGDPTPTITAGYSGLLGGDTFITGVSCSTTYVPGDAAGTYATSCSGPASTSDYTSISYVGGTLTVNPSSATVTVTASSPSVTYGDPTPTITAGYSGLLGGDTFITGVSCSTTYVPGDAAGTYATSCSGPASTSDYTSISYVGGTLTVNPSSATVTVTASSPSVTYGDPTPTITAGYSGLLGGDTFITGVSCSTTYVPGDAAGTYATSCSGPASTSDYTSISYVGGTLTVSGAAPSITSSSSTSGTTGTAFTFTVTTSGTPTPTVGVDTADLPSWLHVSYGTGTATLTGTPTTPGTYLVYVDATNGISPYATQTITITVAGTAPKITSSSSTSGTTGTAFTFTVTTSGNPTPTVGVDTADLPSWLHVSYGSGTATLTGTPTTPGTYLVYVDATNGISPYATQTITITVAGTAPKITSSSSTSGTTGTAFTFTVTTSGNPTPTVGVDTADLPSWLHVSYGSGTATLTGTPTTPGTYLVYVDATNGISPYAAQTITITVAGTAPKITSSSSTSGTTGTAFTFTVTTSGTPTPTVGVDTSDLPSWLHVSYGSGTATLTGTPTTPGTYLVYVDATNGISPYATQTITITVAGTAPKITSSSSTSGTVGKAFTFTVTTSGNPTPTVGVDTADLPSWLHVSYGSGKATLTGTPTAAGTYEVYVDATNGISPYATQTITITVKS